MSARIHHISLFVEDMERALYLFRDILKFTLDWHIPVVKGRKISNLLGLPDFECELAYLSDSGRNAAIELSRPLKTSASKPGGDFGDTGSALISVEVQNIDQLYKQLEKEGWHPLSGIMALKAPEGHNLRAFCIHLEKSVLLELFEKNGKST
jgi:catechol 2,3-dioxygenase-like lactoylglutathione lyase family enzyme